MAEEITLTHTTSVQYKSRSGEIKEFRVVQPLDPTQQKLDLKDLQLLGRAIANILREDG